jgi:hypothetical protein
VYNDNFMSNCPKILRQSPYNYHSHFDCYERALRVSHVSVLGAEVSLPVGKRAARRSCGRLLVKLVLYSF